MIIIDLKGLGGFILFYREIKSSGGWSVFCLSKVFDSMKFQLARTPIGTDSGGANAGAVSHEPVLWSSTNNIPLSSHHFLICGTKELSQWAGCGDWHSNPLLQALLCGRDKKTVNCTSQIPFQLEFWLWIRSPNKIHCGWGTEAEAAFQLPLVLAMPTVWQAGTEAGLVP